MPDCLGIADKFMKDPKFEDLLICVHVVLERLDCRMQSIKFTSDMLTRIVNYPTLDRADGHSDIIQKQTHCHQQIN